MGDISFCEFADSTRSHRSRHKTGMHTVAFQYEGSSDSMKTKNQNKFKYARYLKKHKNMIGSEP